MIDAPSQTEALASNLTPAPTADPIPAPADADPQTFDEMGLRPEVLSALSEMGFIDPMPVQQRTFRGVMAGRDLMIQSRTGSGKTAAFGIPFAQGLLDPKSQVVQAMALCPTRELALQVGNECTRIGAHIGLKVAAIYGGAPMGKQIDALKEGVQFVAGTPGRVLDHLRRGTLQLDGLKVLVLDEADEMLSMGFYEEISEILKRCPTDRQTLLFSATIPEDIERIGSRYMRSPEKVSLSTDFVGAREITHSYYMVAGVGRSRDLVQILKIEKPESAIIFCNTREETSLVAEYLRREGMDAEAISSDLTQKDRERVMGRMREGNLHYLVATDIAARGIDISDLSHVINYTFPDSAEVYVHRTGRTGRAGKKGVAISLVSPRELGNFYYLKLTYKIRPEERMLPSEEEEATRRDGERIASLLAQLGGAAPAEEWRALARRLWASEGGEAAVATLLSRQLGAPAAVPTVRQGLPEAVRERLAGPLPAPAPETSDEEQAPARRGRYGAGARRERDGRGPRSRPGDDRAAGRGRETRGRRDEAPRGRGFAEERAARPAAPAPRPAPPPAAPPTSAPAPAAAVNGAATGAPGAEATADKPKRERRRRRRGEGGAAREGGVAPAAARAAREGGAPTIDMSDGREFWEVWADGQGEGPAAGAATPAPTVTRAPAPAPEIPPGCTRLYLSLGRRDGLRPEEIEAFVQEHGVTFQSAQVRGSYTYLIVEDADADADVVKLDKVRHGERDLVCERARR